MDHGPKKITMQQFQKSVLDFFNKHSMAYFGITFVRKQESDLNNTNKSWKTNFSWN